MIFLRSFPKTSTIFRNVSKHREYFKTTICMNYSTRSAETIMDVFDRRAKKTHRERAILEENHTVYDYIRAEFGWRLTDRICDIKRKFEVAVDVGCGKGYIGKHLDSDMVGTLYQMDMTSKLLDISEKSEEVPTINIVGDEEFFPFKPNSLDLVMSSLSLHWVNNLPGTFQQFYSALKNDGCFIGSVFGGDTLFELRVSLQLAEQEIEGGFAPHVSPLTSIQDLGNLLTRAGFTMLTIDVDEMVVGYPSMFELMLDLKGMAENNCAWNRRPHLPRATMMAAAAIYQEMYGKEEGVPATFQVINFIGWKPDRSQKQPAKRGSGEYSIKDIDKLNKLTEQIKTLKKENTPDKDLTKGLEDIANNLQNMKTKSEKDDER